LVNLRNDTINNPPAAGDSGGVHDDHPAGPVPSGRGPVYLGCVMLGYIGIYLCRKNLSVALPAIQKHFSATNAQIGLIASYSTAAYTIGKRLFGPVIDRFGGRICFLLGLAGVALFGGLGAFAVSTSMLALLYSANRFAGATGWGSMAKQVPDWFPAQRLAFPMAVLSLSFVFGGTCASLLAGKIDTWSGGNWRVVMGAPSLVLLVILGVCWMVLPRGPARAPGEKPRSDGSGFRFAQLLDLARIPQFWIVCALSLVLNITRETFNVWTVLFLKSEGGPGLTTQSAAFHSTAFDVCGALGILLLGWVLDRISARRRTYLLISILILLSVVIYQLPSFARRGLWAATAAIGVVGFLSYGPYSLLAGIFAVEIRGKAFLGTVAGFVDASGYFGASIMDRYFGKLLDQGGYLLALHVLAAVTSVSALLCLFLKKSEPSSTSK
jgi:OPA family glycerol-3-phosphate transporter-like MFS transporter